MTFEQLKKELELLSPEQLKQKVCAYIDAEFADVTLACTVDNNVLFILDLKFEESEDVNADG